MFLRWIEQYVNFGGHLFVCLGEECSGHNSNIQGSFLALHLESTPDNVCVGTIWDDETEPWVGYM